MNVVNIRIRLLGRGRHRDRQVKQHELELLNGKYFIVTKKKLQ